MIELLNFIISFAITYFLMKLALGLFNLNQQAKELQRAEFLRYLDKVVHSVKEEQHGDQIYWFDSDKDQFITQGKTRSEIIENLKKHFYNHIFIVDDYYILCGPDWVPVADKPVSLKMVDK